MTLSVVTMSIRNLTMKILFHFFYECHVKAGTKKRNIYININFISRSPLKYTFGTHFNDRFKIHTSYDT